MRTESPYPTMSGTNYGIFVISYTFAFASQHIPGENMAADVTSPEWYQWKMENLEKQEADKC